MIIKNAKIQPIIGVEVNSFEGTSYNTLILVIEAKDIDSKDFENIPKLCDCKITFMNKDNIP